MRTLLIRPGGIGDCIVSLPAMAALASSDTEVWTNPACIPLIPFANRVRCANARGIFLLEVREFPILPDLLASLHGFSEVFSWYGIGEPTALNRLRSIRPRITFFEPMPPENGPTHAVDFYCDQVEEVTGKSVAERIPMLSAHLRTGERRGIVIRPFASGTRKEWPVERFAQLARALRGVDEVHWLLRPSEDLPFEPVGTISRIEALSEVAAFIARRRLYIGNDTGISHLAAAVGTPSVVLFGPSDPAVWAPRGTGPVEAIRSQTHRTADLSLDTVVQAARRLLEV